MDVLFGCCYPDKKETLIMKEDNSNIFHSAQIEHGKSGINDDYSIQPSRNKNLKRGTQEKEHNIPLSISSFKPFNINNIINNLNHLNIEENTENIEKNTGNNKDILTSLSNLQRRNSLLTDEDVKKASTLILETLEGDILFNQKLEINAYGLSNSERNKKDGVTLFGPIIRKDNIIINDFLLNLNEISELDFPHIFSVFYVKEKNKYYIKAFKEISQKKANSFPIVIVKLSKPHIIKKKQIFKISDMYFQVVPIENKMIELYKIEKSIKEKIKYVFSVNDSPITIGRSPRCNISFENEKSFSRIQCSLVYNCDDECWVLQDGSDKPSTNGTWLYAQHSYELENDCLFRVYNSIIKVTFKENDY